MKYKILAFFLLNNVFLIHCQNLVKNSGFEEYWFFPESLIRCDTSFCKYWYSVYVCTPDYYHKDNYNTNFKSKNNAFGNCSNYFGNAYVGLSLLSWDGEMEHITGTLKKTLIKGEKYNVSIKIKFVSSNCRFYLNRLGVRFSSRKDWVHKDAWVSFDYLYSNNIFHDVVWNQALNTKKWITLKKEYVAVGNEAFITIGVFPNPSSINEFNFLKYLELNREGNQRKLKKFFLSNQSILVKNSEYSNPSVIDVGDGAYYFIDDVSITPAGADL